MTHFLADLRANGVDVTFREWRLSKRLTSLEVARLIGVSVHTIRHAETGRRPLIERHRVKMQALIDGWNESMRPVRGPERRGGWRPRKVVAEAAE